MKIPKKVKAIFMAVIMLLSMGLNGLVASAAAPDNGSITIHKYDGLTVDPSYEHDGSLIEDKAGTDDLFDRLKTLKGLNGVDFTITKVIEIDAERLAVIQAGADGTLGTGDDDGVLGTDYFLDATSGRYFEPDTDISANQTITTAGGGAGVAATATTTGRLPLGIYYVVEKDDGTHTVGKPFFVQIPMTADNGSTLIYDVHVYPKNEVLEIGKTPLKYEDLLADAVGGNNIVTWEISATIPSSIADAKVFEIKDTLDTKLNYIGANGIRVRSATNGGGFDLSPYFKADYERDGTNRTITVRIKTQAELDAYNTDALANDPLHVDIKFSDLTTYPKVYVTFDTKINVSEITDADLNLVNNKATLSFENNQGYKFEDETGPVDPIPVGINIFKYETSTGAEKALPGAVFYIFNNEDNAKAAVNLPTITATTPGVLLKNDGTAWSATSDTNGNVIFYGLTAGTYYIVESQAPGDYNKLSAPIEIVITVDVNGKVTATVGGDAADIHKGGVIDADGRVVYTKVLNNEGFKLPLTGGTGTMLFTLFGLLLIGAAVVIYTISKKRKEQQA